MTQPSQKWRCIRERLRNFTITTILSLLPSSLSAERLSAKGGVYPCRFSCTHGKAAAFSSAECPSKNLLAAENASPRTSRMGKPWPRRYTKPEPVKAERSSDATAARIKEIQFWNGLGHRC